MGLVGFQKLKNSFFFYILVTVFSLNYSVTSYLLNVEGNVTVIGLFEIFEPKNDECSTTVVPSSVMAAEAVKWFFQRLNNANALKLKIGVRGYKTCRLDSLAAQVAIDVSSQSTCTRMNESDSPIIGIIGPEFSSEVEAVAPIFSSVKDDSKLPTVGYSTSAENLGHNRFPNFFRVVPNDGIQIETMVQTMLTMEWNRIAIVYENDIYGQHAMASLKERAEMNDICVAYTASINTRKSYNLTEISTIVQALLLGTNENDRARIEGYIFFGTASTAGVFLRIIDTERTSDVPIGLFSDGINMDLSAFKKDGSFMVNTIGSLNTSPTYRVISEFERHWKQIFTNTTKFREENQTNPWLFDVYCYLKQPCDRDQFQFIPLTDEEFKANFPEQPLYIQYAIMASHAIAKTLSIVYQNICPVNSMSCDFSSTYSYNGIHMITTMKNISLNFATDFTDGIENVTIANLSGIQMSFHDTGEFHVDNDTALYRLFNLQGSQKKSVFKKIGDFINGEIILSPLDNSSATTWLDKRKGECPTRELCKECIPSDLAFHFIHDPGDLYLIGLVPVSNKNGNQDCGQIRTLNGYKLAEGIRLAAEKFNEPNGSYSNYFHGIKVGVVILNTCNNPTVTQRKILNLHKDGLRLPNGTLIKLADKILGYAGPLGSTVSIGISSTLDYLQKVWVSYAATNPTLGDRETHKYFMRVVPPDNEQANAMAHILEELEVNYVQILYSEDAYGDGGMSSLKSALTSRGICIIRAIEVPESDVDHNYYSVLRHNPQAKVVIVFLRSHVLVPLMKTLTANIERGEFVFIGSEAWGKNQDMLVNDNEQTLSGSYTIVLEFAQDNELLSKEREIKPQSYAENPWAEQYLQAKWECYYSTSYDKRYQNLCEDDYSNKTILDPWATSAYFSSLAMLIGAGSYLEKECGTGSTTLCRYYLNNPQGLMNETRNTVKLDILGNGNPTRVFNDNGDGNIGYSIYNIQRDGQSLFYKKIGQYHLNGTFTFNKRLVVYPKSGKIVSRCPNEQVCSSCTSEPQPQTQDEDEDEGGLNPWIFVLLVLFLLSIGAAITLGIVLYRTKRQPDELEMYLTPVTETDNRSKTDYDDFEQIERPAAVGGSDEVCTEMPHNITRETVAPTIKGHQTTSTL